MELHCGRKETNDSHVMTNSPRGGGTSLYGWTGMQVISLGVKYQGSGIV